VYLEAALLVACGYGIEDVKTWMGRLGRREIEEEGGGGGVVA
jgi:hypothetical protein